MENRTLRSFLVVLVTLTCLMVINILTSAGHLYKVVEFSRSYGKWTTISDHPTAITQTQIGGKEKEQVSNITIKSPDKTTPKPKSSTQAEPKAREDSCKNCFVHNFTYLLQNTSICKVSGNQTVELIMLIMTVHGNVKQRMNIRNSWASYAKNNTGKVRYGFLLGKTSDKVKMAAVHEEGKIYGDILMEDFKDSYSNLTYKTMMAMKWAINFCPHSRYLLKTDDDMWVNVPELLKLLDNRGEELEKAVGGACHKTAGPIRSKKSKWYASVLSYPHSRYPGFCSGTGYVTSMTVAKKIYEISPNVPFFHLEDVYVAICINKLHLSLLPLPGFHNFRTALKPCEMRSSKIITSHQVPTDFLHEVMEAKC